MQCGGQNIFPFLTFFPFRIGVQRLEPSMDLTCTPAPAATPASPGNSVERLQRELRALLLPGKMAAAAAARSPLAPLRLNEAMASASGTRTREEEAARRRREKDQPLAAAETSRDEAPDTPQTSQHRAFDLEMERSKAQTLALLSSRHSLSARQEIESWEREATDLLACVSSANKALLLERQDRVQVDRENQTLKQRNEGLAEQLSAAKREVQEAVQASKALREENERLSQKLASVDMPDETEGEDEVAGLRRRVTYWRERDRQAAARREEEREAERISEAERYKKQVQLEKKVTDAEADALKLRSTLEDLRVRHSRELQTEKGEHQRTLDLTKQEAAANLIACRVLLEAEAREQKVQADEALAEERRKFRCGGLS